MIKHVFSFLTVSKLILTSSTLVTEKCDSPEIASSIESSEIVFFGQCVSKPDIHSCRVKVHGFFKGKGKLVYTQYLNKVCEKHTLPPKHYYHLNLTNISSDICDSDFLENQVRIITATKSTDSPSLSLTSKPLRLSGRSFSYVRSLIKSLHTRKKFKIKHFQSKLKTLTTTDLCDKKYCAFGAVCQIQENSPVCLCQNNCENIHQPVCSVEHKTFQNSCMLKYEQCQTQKRIYVSKKNLMSVGFEPTPPKRLEP